MTQCAKCKIELSPDITGMHEAKEGWVCDDCSYDVLGEEFENHPVGGRGIRGPHDIMID